METIVAPLCGTNTSGSVQVLRISGSETASVLEKIIASPAQLFLNSHKLFLKKIINPKTKQAVDQGLVVYFKAPRSYTGEDSAELHLHASSFIVNEVTSILLSLGVKLAEPGEFTKRAFLNGQIDLLQAEAVADLIASQTEAQAKLASEQLAGRLSNVVDEIAEPLRDLLAIIEAHIDFPEEGIELQTSSVWLKTLILIEAKVEKLLASYTSGRIAREGAQVVLAGIPNVGKSSLLNALAGQNRAIVTNIAGTTRDSIEQRISLEGFAVSLWDTAGLAEAGEREIDEIEKIGIQRSWERIAQADLIVFIFDPTQDMKIQEEFLRQIQTSASILRVFNKADLVKLGSIEDALIVSANSKEDISQLASKIVRELGLKKDQDLALLSNLRHKQAVEKSLERIKSAATLLKQEISELEIVALELRSSLFALTELVGVTENEDVLGRIFSKFCIGK